MFQCRNLRPRRLAGLLRLFELLRITKQDQAACPPGHGQDVGQSHLPGLVDEQDIDTVGEVLARPQPRRTAQHRVLATVEQRADTFVVIH